MIICTGVAITQLVMGLGKPAIDFKICDQYLARCRSEWQANVARLTLPPEPLAAAAAGNGQDVEHKQRTAEVESWNRRVIAELEAAKQTAFNEEDFAALPALQAKLDTAKASAATGIKQEL